MSKIPFIVFFSIIILACVLQIHWNRPTEEFSQLQTETLSKTQNAINNGMWKFFNKSKPTGNIGDLQKLIEFYPTQDDFNCKYNGSKAAHCTNPIIPACALQIPQSGECAASSILTQDTDPNACTVRILDGIYKHRKSCISFADASLDNDNNLVLYGDNCALLTALRPVAIDVHTQTNVTSHYIDNIMLDHKGSTVTISSSSLQGLHKHTIHNIVTIYYLDYIEPANTILTNNQKFDQNVYVPTPKSVQQILLTNDEKNAFGIVLDTLDMCFLAGKSEQGDVFYYGPKPSGLIKDFARSNTFLGQHGQHNIPNIAKLVISAGFNLSQKGVSNIITYERKIEKSHMVKEVKGAQNYKLDFHIKPLVENKKGGWKNILRFTQTNRNCCNPGDRNPAVWFIPGTLRLHIRSGRKGNWNDGINPSPQLPLNKYTHVEVIVNEGNMIVKYDGKIVGRNNRYKVPFRPASLLNVWVGDGHPPAEAFIKNVNYLSLDIPREVNIVNAETKLKRGLLVKAFKPSLDYRVQLYVKPLSYNRGGWKNIIRFTSTAKNCCAEGDRVPAIWFRPRSNRLHIRSSRKGNGNDGIDPMPTLPINKYTHVDVEVYKGKMTVRYDGREVGTNKNYKYPANNNNKLQTVYLSDSFYPEADAYVKEVQYTRLD